MSELDRREQIEQEPGEREPGRLPPGRSDRTADGEPEQAPVPARRGLLRRFWWIPGIAIAVVVVVVLAPLASGDPDGLEWVAGEQGFIASAQDALYSIFPGYTIPGVDDPVVSTVLAGLIGVGIVFAIMFGLGRLLARRRS